MFNQDVNPQTGSQACRPVSNTYKSSIFNMGETERPTPQPKRINQQPRNTNNIFQTNGNANVKQKFPKANISKIPMFNESNQQRPSTAPCRSKRAVGNNLSSTVFNDPHYPDSQQSVGISRPKTAWKYTSRNTTSTVFSSDSGQTKPRVRKSLQKKSTVFDTQGDGAVSPETNKTHKIKLSNTFRSSVMSQKQEPLSPRSFVKSFEMKCSLSNGCNVVEESRPHVGIRSNNGYVSKNRSSQSRVMGGQENRVTDVITSANSNGLINYIRGKKPTTEIEESTPCWSNEAKQKSSLWSSGFNPSKIADRSTAAKITESTIFSSDNAKPGLFSADGKCSPMKSI
uniref:Uncharacterized LOC100183365 n=2 Tax=Ciona intestinalis TaxID=7719 RepID=F6TLV8_CIOIN